MKIVVLLIFIFFFLALIAGIWGLINAVVLRVRPSNCDEKNPPQAQRHSTPTDREDGLPSTRSGPQIGQAHKTVRVLQDLQRMLKNGELTQSEYDSIKRRIMEDIHSESLSA